LAFSSRANYEKVDRMSEQSLSGVRIARLLGDWRAPGPAYAALAAALRMLVLDGRLPLRARLPAERQLAAALRVSRTTVTAAYEQLRAEGYLHSRQGSGSWTALPADRHRAPAAAPWAPADPLGAPLLDLAQATLPAPEGVLPQAVGVALEELPRYLPTHGYDPFGLVELRSAVADHYTERGLPTGADDILVTNGAQHAFGLILRLLIGPGDRVLVEHPTYPNALDMVRRLGGRLVPVGLDPDGWDLDTMRTTLGQTAPRVAYLIPDFHNPTGLCMDGGTREALADLARVTGTPLVIDETLASLWLSEAEPPAPVAAHDRAGMVVTVGSVSKTFWGGLRIGWIRAAPELRRRLATLRGTLDMGSPVLEQLVCARLLRDAEATLVPRRAALRQRRDVFVSALRRSLPTWQLNPPAGGLSLWAELDAPVSTALVMAAEARGVRLVAGPRFGVDGAFERFVRLPFTQPEAVLLDAAGRLAGAYRAVTDRPVSQAALEPVT
jgi:DNA-binding transcriptional MocR family regulator